MLSNHGSCIIWNSHSAAKLVKRTESAPFCADRFLEHYNECRNNDLNVLVINFIDIHYNFYPYFLTLYIYPQSVALFDAYNLTAENSE